MYVIFTYKTNCCTVIYRRNAFVLWATLIKATPFKRKKGNDSRHSLFCGATWNRTRDTRIFSPLLYQLSYGTIMFFAGTNVTVPFCGCKYTESFYSAK